MTVLAVSSAAVALVLFAKCRVTPPSMRKQLSAWLDEMVHGPNHYLAKQKKKKGIVDVEGK